MAMEWACGEFRTLTPPRNLNGAYGKQLGLNVPCQMPGKNWCWAALTAGVTNYLKAGANATACSIATRCFKGKNYDCCSAPAQCDTPMMLSEVFSRCGVQFYSPEKSLHFADIVKIIDANLPVCCYIVGDRFSHFIAIDGYESQRSDISICDSWFGPCVQPFSTFWQGYRGGYWNKSYIPNRVN